MSRDDLKGLSREALLALRRHLMVTLRAVESVLGVEKPSVESRADRRARRGKCRVFMDGESEGRDDEG
jgi:hypothetical protein